MPKHFALIPAAGVGSRMQADLPKQYLPLLERPMLYYAIKHLADCEQIERVYVVLAQDDAYFPRYDWSIFAPKLSTLFCGGETRANSVANGLEAMQVEVSTDDWVLVHDAARPCLRASQLNRLLNELTNDPVGGLLAVPIFDTVKRVNSELRVIQTEKREDLWRAQTPQMFRFGMLKKALSSVDSHLATDEARAIEHIGLHPKLVMGDERNLKVTYLRDVNIAEATLREMEKT